MNAVVNVVCNAVTNGVRRNVQNQNQNQIQSSFSCGRGHANQSIHSSATLLRGAAASHGWAADAAGIGGGSCR